MPLWPVESGSEGSSGSSTLLGGPMQELESKDPTMKGSKGCRLKFGTHMQGNPRWSVLLQGKPSPKPELEKLLVNKGT